MHVPDVVVIGGGLVGTSLAYELSTRGLAVTLLDAAHVGKASDAGAGIVSPQTIADPDEEWFAFAGAAASHLRRLLERAAESGASFASGTFDQCGSLVVAMAEHEEPWFEETARTITARSPGMAEVSGTEALGMFPGLGQISRALYNPSAARMDGRRFNRGLRSALRRSGAVVSEQEAVGLESSGERVDAVLTTGGPLSCGAVAIAGGAWSGRWAEQLGTALPVAPTKGQIVHVISAAHEHTSGSWPIVQPILNFYLVPWPAGRVACGGTFEAAGFDTRPTATGMRDLLRELVVIAPGLAEATFLEVRVGLRPTSSDDRPLLGAVPGWANVYVCTGHGANGLMLGAYSAALVADAVCNPRAATALPYGPERFCA